MGTFNTVKATLSHLRASNGSYIHVSATLHYRGKSALHGTKCCPSCSHLSATPFQPHVSAAKAGVDALSAVLAVEEGPHGVRSNVIAPGPIGGTEGVDRLSSRASDAQARWRESLPLRRIGHVDDVANATVFLFSEAANWITGQILVVDGGNEHIRTMQFPYPESVLDPAATAKHIKPRL